MGGVAGFAPAVGPPGVRELGADLAGVWMAQQVEDVGGALPRVVGGGDIAGRVVRVTE